MQLATHMPTKVLSPTPSTARNNTLAEPVRCNGCNRPGNKSRELSQCLHCHNFYYAECFCTCGKDRVLGDFTYQPAQEAIRTYFLNNPDLHAVGFTVEDECGGLEYIHGNLSALFGQNPLIDRIAAEQLPASMVKVYKDQQLAVWRKKIRKAARLSLGSGWSVVILPLALHGNRYTVSVFSQAN